MYEIHVFLLVSYDVRWTYHAVEQSHNLATIIQDLQKKKFTIWNLLHSITSNTMQFARVRYYSIFMPPYG